jgi:hypothetical protein
VLEEDAWYWHLREEWKQNAIKLLMVAESPPHDKRDAVAGRSRKNGQATQPDSSVKRKA